MSLIGTCSDCGTGGVSLRYKPEVPVNEQSRPSICDRCRDFREEQATHYVPCEKCGDRVPSERAKSLDVTAEDEYYPEFIHFCPTCRPDANDDDADLMTDGGTELGVLCDVDDCEARIVGLDDGWQMSRGTVCQDCIDYHDRHGHWPDEDAEACVECRIDDGAINHDCDEFSGDGVILTPGDTCDYCGFEAAVTDGGEEANCALAALLEELSKGDRFTVDCHDSVLCVHSTGEFIGPVFLDVFDEDGGHWPVASVDGDLYLGYSQLEPADDQSRAKRIKDVEIIDQQETPSLVPDGGEEVGRAIPQAHNFQDVCEECGGSIDTTLPGYYKSPSELFKHELCHENGSPPPQYELAENHDYETHTNRQYNCGHVLYAPPKRQPTVCPVCNPIDVEVVRLER